MKPVHKKLDNGKILRISQADVSAVIDQKLSNKEALAKHDAQIDIYIKANQQIVDRQYMHYMEALAYGKEVKKEFPEYGYRIIQIVENN